MAEQTNEKNDLVILNLDRPRVVRFGHKALKMLTRLTGKNFTKIGDDDFDLSELEMVLYCGILADAQEHGEDLKLEDMEDLLDKAPNMMVIVNAMNQGLDNAFQQTEKQKN